MTGIASRLHPGAGRGRDGAMVTRVGVISVHTSPLDQPGAGDGGGLNVYVREVAERLAGRGVHVDVFTRRTSHDQPETVEIVPGVEVHHIEAGPARALDKDEVANQLCAFVLALQRHRTAGTHDVLHAHYWLSGWAGRRVTERWDTPLVQTFHTLGALKNANLAPGDLPEPPLRLAAEERVARDADRILVLTCGEARLLHRTYGLSGAKLTVVPPGVDLSRFHPSSLAGSADHRDAPGRAPELLFVGRLQPLKGPDVAVRTLAEVRRTLPDARLRIIGGVSGSGAGLTGPDQLRALAEELGVGDGLILEPAVDQTTLADRYRAADVVLVPSRSETFGLVALEAQACGVPVVAAQVAGLEAVVGAGGTLVPGHEPRDHAAAALAFLTDPGKASDAVVAGVAAARAASWDRTVDRLLTAYGEVAASHRALATGPVDDIAV
jgi:D-inositol-3-phosphate glycosyltransferase